MKIKTILIATDFSEDSKAALHLAVDFSEKFGSRLRVIHACQAENPAMYGGFGGDFVITPGILEPVRRGAEASLEGVVKEAGSSGLDVSGRVVMENAVSAIIDEAEQVSADLIVLGTRGLTGLKHVLIGSTAERIVRLAECPVITVKGKQ